MFGYDDVHSFSVCIGDPAADKKISLLRAPAGGITITKLTFTDGVAMTAGDGTAIVLTVYNGGTSGTATTVVGSAHGGTTVNHAAQTPYAFDLGDGSMSEGQYLWVNYDETGTVTPYITIHGEYRLGKAD